MKNLKELLAKLGLTLDLPVDLTDPRITPEAMIDLKAALRTEYDRLRGEATPDLAALQLLNQGRQMVQGEIADRETAVTAAEQAAIDLAAADAAAKDLDDKKDAPAVAMVGQGLTVTATDPNAPAADPAEVAKADVTPPAATAPSPELAMVAAAQPPVEQGAGGAGATPKGSRWRTAAAAVADFGHIGVEIDLFEIHGALSHAMTDCVNATDQGTAFGKAVVASLPAIVETDFDQDHILMKKHGPEKNSGIIRQRLAAEAERLSQLRGGGAVTAAAPWCEPFDVIRRIPNDVNTATPVFNSLPFVPMGYGGFTFNQGYEFSDLIDAVDIWTSDDQSNIDPTDPDTWKRCMTLSCPDDLPTVTLDDYLTACLEWQVGVDLNNPERFADAFKYLEGQRARLKEQYTLSLLDALTVNYKNSTVGTSYRVIGGLPDFIAAIKATFQGITYDTRATGRSGYTMYLDTIMMDALVIAEMRAAFAKTDASPGSIKAAILRAIPEISQIIDVIDRVPGAYGSSQANGNPHAAVPAAGGALVAIPAIVVAGLVRLIPTAEVFAFGTGEMRTGVRQDFSYARQNKVGWFAEEAFALTKFGVQPWFKIAMDIVPSGYYVGTLNRQATAETDPFAAAMGTWVADNANPDDPDPNP